LKAFIATRAIAGAAEKFSPGASCDDPRAPLSIVIVDVLPIAAVLDAERFVAAVSSDRPQNGAIVVGSSTATIAVPSAGTPCCSNEPSDALAETSLHIPSTNTLAFADAGIAAVSFARCAGVAFSVELTDLDWGSWEGSLPESSSLGGDAIPLRGAFIWYRWDSRTHCGDKLYQLCGAGDILVAINLWRSGPSWSDEMAHSFAATDTQRPTLRNCQPSEPQFFMFHSVIDASIRTTAVAGKLSSDVV
jgi:hypothetical protein